MTITGNTQQEEEDVNNMMKTETESAANFLVNLLRMRSGDLGEERLGELRDALVKVMRARYEGHWHEDAPPKGCGYRCVRVNTRMDPMVEEAARPRGFVLEQGTICTAHVRSWYKM